MWSIDPQWTLIWVIGFPGSGAGEGSSRRDLGWKYGCAKAPGNVVRAHGKENGPQIMGRIFVGEDLCTYAYEGGWVFRLVGGCWGGSDIGNIVGCWWENPLVVG